MNRTPDRRTLLAAVGGGVAAGVGLELARATGAVGALQAGELEVRNETDRSHRVSVYVRDARGNRSRRLLRPQRRTRRPPARRLHLPGLDVRAIPHRSRPRGRPRIAHVRRPATRNPVRATDGRGRETLPATGGGDRGSAPARRRSCDLRLTGSAPGPSRRTRRSGGDRRKEGRRADGQSATGRSVRGSPPRGSTQR